MGQIQISILVVDDEADLRELMQDTFEMEGFHVHTAVDGLDALEKLKEIEVDVILADSFMPRMSGLELLDSLTSCENRSLFYLATGAIDVSLDDLKKRGAAGFFEKPYDIDEVIAKIQGDLKLQG